MKATFALSALALGLGLAIEPTSLATRYSTERQLAVEAETTLELETVELSIERDGERMDPRGGQGSSRVVHRVSLVDRVLALDDDGAPERVRRRFADVSGGRRVEMGDQDFESEADSPFDGIVLELSREDGEIEARVISGRGPDAADALEGHRLTLSLDALLPGKPVEVGDEWELGDRALRHALGLDVMPKLFPRPERDEGSGERGGRGGGRGGRGFQGRGGGGGELLALGTWSGTARLADLDHEHEGTVCALIELEIEARGELPERGGFGGGRGGRGGRLAEPHGPAPALSGSFRIELTGQLLFAVEAGRPVLLELAGDVHTERDSEMGGRGGATMRMRQVQQGSLRHVVTVSEEPVAAD